MSLTLTPHTHTFNGWCWAGVIAALLGLWATSVSDGVATITLLTCAMLLGKKDDSKDFEKEEMFRQQQELLEARRSGKTLQDASARRQRVSVRDSRHWTTLLAAAVTLSVCEQQQDCLCWLVVQSDQLLGVHME